MSGNYMLLKGLLAKSNGAPWGAIGSIWAKMRHDLHSAGVEIGKMLNKTG